MRALWLIPAIAALGARLPVDECGWHPGRTHEEIFLHRQHAALRARAKLPAASGSTNQDIGNIAVIDDSGGVIGRRNPFTLDGKTLTFTPGPAGYTVSTRGDSFDPEASNGGPLLSSFGDDDARRFDLPFAFSFFGASYKQVWVDSNGMLTFGAGDASSSGSFGYFQAARPAIAGLFTDLDPSESSDGVHVLAESGRFVATWSQVPLFGAFQTETFQVRLYPDGRIEIAYRGMRVNDGVAGISPGGHATVPLADFATASTGAFPSGVAEIFASSDAVDIVAAAQKFYQTHDDAYDYLIFFNSESVAAGPGVVAYESTVRSKGQGYGDVPYDYGADFGSARRLLAVLNLGPLAQYPADPNAPVPARGSTGDTPLSIMGHEAGHLYLALVSVPDPSNADANPPMLGRSLVHWAFTFNSEASFLEGNRINDRGAGQSPRFETTATVATYSALDRYLMGLIPPEQVPPMFAVLKSNQSPARPPQTGVSFDGDRFDIRIEDLIKSSGRRVPDSTVAQRRYRFAIVLIVPPGAQPAASDVAQVDRYRTGFETLFSTATGGIAVADTSLKRAAALSLFPSSGVTKSTAVAASIEIATPAPADVSFAISTQRGFLSAPASVAIPAGSTRATFSVRGISEGVDEVLAVPSDPKFETTFARVQVAASGAGLHLTAVSSDPSAVVVRVADANEVPYPGVSLLASVSDQGSVKPSPLATDEHGLARLQWTPGASNVLTVSIPGGASLQITPFGRPVIAAAANSASFSTHIAPGSFVALGGTNLAGGGTPIVRVNGRQALVYPASESFLNFVAPAVAPAAATIVVQSPAGTSDPLPVAFDATAPGIFFEASSGYGAILIAGTADVTQIRPARPGDYISIYCTGLGDSPNAQVRIANVDVAVSYAGPTSIPGLDQINASIQTGLPPGTQTLTLMVNGISANPVKIQIAP